MKFILGNHWTSAPQGWTVLKQEDQDLTAPLKWADNSVDVIFTEHVVEHLKMTDTILFFKEAHRILKDGGILRTVCPFINQIARIVSGRHHDELLENYFNSSIQQYYRPELAVIHELGIDPFLAWKQLMVDSLIKNHGHQMVWDSEFMCTVLKKIGFRDVMQCHPGETEFDDDTCLERRYRGVDAIKAAEYGMDTVDFEGFVVEALK